MKKTLAILFVLTVFLSACSPAKMAINGEMAQGAKGGVQSVENSLPSRPESAPFPEKGVAGDMGTIPSIPESRKIIKRANLSMETTSFEVSVQTILNKATLLGGYVESSSISGSGVNPTSGNQRSAQISIRIPQDKFDQFLSATDAIGNITTRQVSGEDVTEYYFDTESRLKALRIQEERMLALLEKADSLTDIIELEKALTEVRVQIESLTTTLNHYDSLISFNQVYINVLEVYQITVVNPMPATLGQRIGNSFSASVKALLVTGENVLVMGIAAIPFISTILVIGGLAILARNLFRKKKPQLK